MPHNDILHFPQKIDIDKPSRRRYRKESQMEEMYSILVNINTSSQVLHHWKKILYLSSVIEKYYSVKISTELRLKAIAKLAGNPNLLTKDLLEIIDCELENLRYSDGKILKSALSNPVFPLLLLEDPTLSTNPNLSSSIFAKADCRRQVLEWKDVLKQSHNDYRIHFGNKSISFSPDLAKILFALMSNEKYLETMQNKEFIKNWRTVTKNLNLVP